MIGLAEIGSFLFLLRVSFRDFKGFSELLLLVKPFGCTFDFGLDFDFYWLKFKTLTFSLDLLLTFVALCDEVL